MLETNKIDIKIVGASGQVYIGKEFAGKQIQLVKKDDSTIVITKGQFIPDNEKWLYRDNNLEKLMKAVEWSENTPRRNDNFEEIMNKLEAAIND